MSERYVACWHCLEEHLVDEDQCCSGCGTMVPDSAIEMIEIEEELVRVKAELEQAQAKAEAWDSLPDSIKDEYSEDKENA